MGLIRFVTPPYVRQAYHTICLKPMLVAIPEEDWFCPCCGGGGGVQPAPKKKAMTKAKEGGKSKLKPRPKRPKLKPTARPKKRRSPYAAQPTDEPKRELSRREIMSALLDAESGFL